MSATLRGRDITFETATLAAVSSWEAAALISNRVPTVTSQVMRLPRSLRRLLVAGVAVWLARHFQA